MTTMIERVARAIMKSRGGCKVSDWREAEWNPAVAQALTEARAAIAAMREPTPNMYIKGGIAISDVRPQSETYADESSACWTVMIDAALEEKP